MDNEGCWFEMGGLRELGTPKATSYRDGGAPVKRVLSSSSIVRALALLLAPADALKV